MTKTLSNTHAKKTKRLKTSNYNTKINIYMKQWQYLAVYKKLMTFISHLHGAPFQLKCTVCLLIINLNNGIQDAKQSNIERFVFKN